MQKTKLTGNTATHDARIDVMMHDNRKCSSPLAFDVTTSDGKTFGFNVHQDQVKKLLIFLVEVV